ncbi:hypothetical protein PAXRUDRAFT_166404 [Paxillus rubicundulus Ve08.2h10]|uniref:Secreted protein n=1 Tax=Paxillus rubicundulus Ve08.2h10 TaxID=930991 RepID=A0A0D0DAM6_9AGAM|nr:hypothetical protein PAXRUDRAFT_166404 [Paxillus rubicundulus Ve08.2h10]
MQTFLTLLAAMISLSVYALVGVHAQRCPLCPPSLQGVSLNSKCVSKPGITQCIYRGRTGRGSSCKYSVRAR